MKLTTTSLVIALALVCTASCNSASHATEKLTWHTGDAWTRVAELEDARKTGDGELVRLLASEDAALRARVATALGRMPFPEVGAEVTRSLLEALFDSDANVRAAAAFGLGMRGDASAADKLLFVALDYHEADKDAVVRARALKAASKLDRPELRDRMLDGLLDSDPRVRLEAAEGASRWALSEESASAVNQRLVDSLTNEKDRDVIVYTLFALERRKAKEAIEVFKQFEDAQDVEQRLFAVRGLKALAPEQRAFINLWHAATGEPIGRMHTTTDSLSFTSLSPDWRIQCEATLGLGAYPYKRTQADLDALTRDANAHIARCAWEARGAQLEIAETLPIETLEPIEKSPNVVAAQVEAIARGMSKKLVGIEPPKSLDDALDYPARANLKDTLLRDCYSMLQEAARTEEPLIRVGAARGAAHLPSPHALSFLTHLAHDPNLVVAGAAIEGLGKHNTPASRALLHQFLENKDNGLRLAAVTSLAEMLDPSDLAPLKKCFDTSTGDGAVEIRFNVLRSVGKIGGDDGLAILVAAFADPNPFVRKVAREEVERSQPLLKVTDIDVHIADERPAFVPVAGRDFPRYERNPQVEVVTSRGTMRFELFPQEAPTHVFNFLAQIERKHYDGLSFHRVVPDFVIQGGDYRGDGNGGGTWRGEADALRHEISPRKYVRGSLGMPRNEDSESGGSQFFVTHRPTPHLDGRYTIFGELREGFDVLDAIEVGDKIVSVRVVN